MQPRMIRSLWKEKGGMKTLETACMGLRESAFFRICSTLPHKNACVACFGSSADVFLVCELGMGKSQSIGKLIKCLCVLNVRNKNSSHTRLWLRVRLLDEQWSNKLQRLMQAGAAPCPIPQARARVASRPSRKGRCSPHLTREDA